MARACKCDICGTLYEPYRLNADNRQINAISLIMVSETGRMPKNQVVQECCPGCMQDIWIIVSKRKQKQK